MSDLSATSRPPISGWDPALQSIVRCLEALDASQKNYEREHWSARSHPDRYGGLFSRIEDFLIAEGRPNSWGAEALAELSLGTGYIPPARSIRYLFDAAEAGYLNAQLELARMAGGGNIPPPEYNWEVKADNRWISPERWDEFNRDESDRWWKEAAENDSAFAQYVMCNGLIESDDPEHFAQGVKWLKKAAGNRRPHPAAQYDLAYLMELERINPGDPRYSWELYEAAAKADIPEAMLAAGHYLEYGIGVDRDTKAACEWYFKAGKAGLDGGYIANWVLSGPDADSIFAAQAGYAPAMIHLAEYKLSDCCGSISYMPWEYGWAQFEGAIDWLGCASEAGSLKATLRLAEVLEGNSDHHFPEEIREEFLGYAGLERALECYQRAGELGWKHAVTHIERIQKLLDGDNEDTDPDD